MAASDYNKLIPQPTDQLNLSQPALLLNFGAISDLIDVDHVDFAAAGAGKHKKITLPVQSPQPTFDAGDLGLYSYLNTITGEKELYFYSEAGDRIPLSASILSTNGSPATNTPGWTYLPSGLLIKWGSATIAGSATTTFPVSGAIPVFATVLSMSLTTMGSDTDTFVQLASFGATGFIATGLQRTAQVHASTTFQYFAIGY